jgi:hypothetical protein
MVSVAGVPVVLQIGVVPVQLLVTPPSLEVVWQPTHWPAIGPVLAHTGVVPVHGPVEVEPPSGAPASVALAVASGSVHPTHWFFTQKADLGFAVGQSLFCTHCTQPPDAAHTGVLGGHTLPPSGPLTLAQETHVFAEQKSKPASLLHWLLVLQATHLVFTQ